MTLEDFSIEDLQDEITKRIEIQEIKKIRGIFKDIKDIENNFEKGIIGVKDTLDYIKMIIKKHNP